MMCFDLEDRRLKVSIKYICDIYIYIYISTKNTAMPKITCEESDALFIILYNNNYIYNYPYVVKKNV